MMINLKEKPFYLTDKEVEQITNTLNNMSLDEKIRQMFLVLGDAYTKEELIDLVKKGIGGILFRPVRTAKEISNEFDELDKLSKIPLLHAANLEEGGAGASSDGTYFSSQLGIAATSSLDDSSNFARVCAYEGIKTKINWTFSPVSDIDMNFRNPITNCRTYGSNPDNVIKYTTNYVKIVQSKNMAACVKHFPGDGVDYRDQHLHPTYNSLSVSKWRNTYGRIYKHLIKEGVLSFMVGHICAPNMEKIYSSSYKGTLDALPASLSSGLLQGVLRGELGFNGLIATDATIMGGYTMAMERRRAIPTSFKSGIDMIVFSTDINEDFKSVYYGLDEGTLTLDRIDEAVKRILALKMRVCGKGIIDEVDSDSLAYKCAKDSITLVKNNSSFLPLDNNKYKEIRLMLLGNNETHDGLLMDMMAKSLEERGYIINRYNPFDDDLHGTYNLKDDRMTIVMLNYPPASNQTTVRVTWCPKHALEIPRFVNEEAYIYISFGNPYHLQDIPRCQVMINAYNATIYTVEETIRKLCGEEEFVGVNPVDPFCNLEDTRL